MTPFERLPLPDRSIVAVTGADTVGFLDNIVTQALDDVDVGHARFAALLSPQGKILAEFFALRTTDGMLLDTRSADAPALIKRLGLYKLRAKIVIADVSGKYAVYVRADAPDSDARSAFADPRDPRLGWRLIIPDAPIRPVADPAALELYHAHRISLGVPEGGVDYPIGDTYPHEADYDLFAGVSFTKGCFVGQEVVARMQNKTVVRKRVVRVTGAGPLSTGAPVLVGSAEIGRIGSVAGVNGLAMLRLDRAVEARAKGEQLTAGGVPVQPDPQALARYATSLAERPQPPSL